MATRFEDFSDADLIAYCRGLSYPTDVELVEELAERLDTLLEESEHLQLKITQLQGKEKGK